MFYDNCNVVCCAISTLYVCDIYNICCTVIVTLYVVQYIQRYMLCDIYSTIRFVMSVTCSSVRSLPHTNVLIIKLRLYA
jgi:hypothetical protein